MSATSPAPGAMAVMLVVRCGVCCTVGSSPMPKRMSPEAVLSSFTWDHSPEFGWVCPRPECKQVAGLVRAAPPEGAPCA